MEFINKPPQWDNAGTEPTTEEKQQGWAVEDKVPAPYLNWFWNLVSKCISELQTKLHNVDTQTITDRSNITAHIADKNEPHVQRVSVGAMTTLSDIIDGTYTGFDGDEFITSDDIKKFYLTDVGGTHDGVELIVAGSDIDGGCIQVLNVYVSGNVEVSPQICKQYYRTKQMGSWSDWKLVEHLDKELDAASTNAVQNKVVTAEIDNIKANINALPKTGAESGTIATCIKENKTETVAIDVNNPYDVYPEEGYGQYVIEFENTPRATYPVIIHLTTGASLLLYKDKSPLYVSDTKVVIPVPLDDDIDRIAISDNTANTVTVTATSSIFAEVKDGSITADKLSSDFIDAIQMKPTYTAYTISASGWTGDTAPYTYTIEGFDGKTVNIYEDVALATAEQLSALASANIKGSPTSEENILYAFGEKPTIDIPVALGVQ